MRSRSAHLAIDIFTSTAALLEAMKGLVYALGVGSALACTQYASQAVMPAQPPRPTVARMVDQFPWARLPSPGDSSLAHVEVNQLNGGSALLSAFYVNVPSGVPRGVARFMVCTGMDDAPYLSVNPVFVTTISDSALYTARSADASGTVDAAEFGEPNEMDLKLFADLFPCPSLPNNSGLWVKSGQ